MNTFPLREGITIYDSCRETHSYLFYLPNRSRPLLSDLVTGKAGKPFLLIPFRAIPAGDHKTDWMLYHFLEKNYTQLQSHWTNSTRNRVNTIYGALSFWFCGFRSTWEKSPYFTYILCPMKSAKNELLEPKQNKWKPYLVHPKNTKQTKNPRYPTRASLKLGSMEMLI